MRLNADTAAEIYLKLENLQPIGAFKIRGAANAMARLSRDDLDRFAELVESVRGPQQHRVHEQ